MRASIVVKIALIWRLLLPQKGFDDSIYMYITYRCYTYIHKANEGTEPSSLKFDFLIACGPCQVDATPDGQMMVAKMDESFGGGGSSGSGGGGGDEPDGEKIARILKEAAAKGIALEVNVETGQLQKKAPTKSLLIFDPVSKMWVYPAVPAAMGEVATPGSLEDPPGLVPAKAAPVQAKASPPPLLRPPGMPPMMPPPPVPRPNLVAPGATAAAVPDLAPLAHGAEHDAGHAGVAFPPLAPAGAEDDEDEASEPSEDPSAQSWQEDWMRYSI